ncbi:MAG: D-2-hydroxyacid dehydrogenase [Acidimicrobiaceae bacterium]|nr:D-2-hydroxyacid dehydrogenase [Acidimicrobiaceae bacterium]
MTDPLVVGVLYPGEWNLDFDRHLAELAAIDPRIEIVVEPYEEPSELRSGRGVPPYDAVRRLAPELTAAQRDALARIECCIALDLPFDVAVVAPRLRWVQALAAGVAHLTSAGLREAGIRLTNASGANATSIAEFVFARILGEYKRTRRLDTTQQQRRWHPVFGDNMAGATIGLLGFGPINQAVARRARAFELEVIVVRRSAAPSDLAHEILGPDGLHDMLGRSDIVVAAVPESPETHRLFDSSAFAAMRDGAMFVNVGRGTLVDEPALVAALHSGKLRAAALDVTAVEPLPQDSPLWDAPNIYISAHCSTEPTRFFESAHRVFADNLARYVAGQPLLNEISL